MKAETTKRIKELQEAGYSPEKICEKLHMPELLPKLQKQHHSREIHMLNNKVQSLQKELSRRKSFEIELRKSQQRVSELEAKLKSLEGAVESVNSLSAEKSRLVRKLRKAGIKV